MKMIRNGNTDLKGKAWRRDVVLSSLFFAMLVWVPTLLAADRITVTSEDRVEFDKNTGTAFLKGNVVIVRQLDRSVVKADQLHLIRDPAGGMLSTANAQGNVDILIQDPSADDPANASTSVICNSLFLVGRNNPLN